MTDDAALNSLYPFLNETPPDRGALGRALSASVGAKAHDSCEVKARFFQESAAQVVRAATLIADSFRQGGRLLCMGNGGSSCDAAHIAVEFLHPVTTGRPALPAINLTADVAMLTAVANDVGTKHVFARQLIAMGRGGDILIGVSTSGNSENLLAAFATAKKLGLRTVGLSGMSGGRMAQEGELDECLIVRSDSIHRIQETHVAIYHILWDLVHTLLADDRGGALGRPV